MTGAEARRAYQKAWRKKNPDKVKATMERYWNKKAKEADQAAGQEEKKNEG